MAALEKHRLFRFSLRTLLLCVTTLCLFFGWLVYHLNWIEQRRHAQQWIDKYDKGETGKAGMVERRPRLPWSLWILGEEEAPLISFVDHEDDNPDTCEEFQRKVLEIERLFPESQIIEVHRHPLSGPRVKESRTNSGVSNVKLLAP